MQGSMKFCEHVDQFRARMGVTKTAMADRLGLSWDGLNNKLTGKSEFDLDEIIAVADWWGVPIDDLIGRTVPKYPVLEGGN